MSLDDFYITRTLQRYFIDKMIFRGNIHSMPRNSVPLLANYEYFYGGEAINQYDYFNELTQYKIGLSIPGAGELCYRDIEYLGIGIPMLKFEYITQLNPPLIPNFHYISIDRIETERKYSDMVIGLERVGGNMYSEKYIKKFEEIKNDKDFLEYVSKNGREYYEKYLCPLNRFNHIIKLLNID